MIFKHVGSGIKDTIFANYHEVRRIPAVEGIKLWWPRHLISEIIVLVPRKEKGFPLVPQNNFYYR